MGRLANFLSSSAVPVYKNLRLLWLIFWLSALSFLTTLHLPYNGEEAVYTITSLEMWFNQAWISPTQYGLNYGRPPLLNWLMVPLASLLGWENVLLASRCIASFSTLLTAAILMWITQRLFKEKSFAIWTGILYLSGDLLFRRGWLAYADPFFSFFVFTAIALAWIALEENKTLLFLLASICLIASFLTKAITGYVFYGIALFVLACQHQNRARLLSPIAIISLLLSLLFPILWNYFFSQGAHGQSMIFDVLAKLSGENLASYFLKILLFPFNTWLRWLPVSGILLYVFLLAKRQHLPFTQKQSADFKHFKIAFWIFLLNVLPYWLAPQAHLRYLLPLYPLFALCSAYIILRFPKSPIRLTLVLLISCLVLKYILGLWGYGFIDKKIRGDYRAIAQDILKKTAPYPICIQDVTATGLSVTAEIDVLHLPKPPLRYCEVQGNNDFLLLSSPDVLPLPNGKMLQVYPVGNHKLYLFCRGLACQQ